MNLLLLLSALLSALTGVGASAGASMPATAVAGQVAAPAVARRGATAVLRPVNALPNILSLHRVVGVIASTPAVGQPIYLQRRRE